MSFPCSFPILRYDPFLTVKHPFRVCASLCPTSCVLLFRLVLVSNGKEIEYSDVFKVVELPVNPMVIFSTGKVGGTVAIGINSFLNVSSIPYM